jgi:hypothetical protein
MSHSERESEGESEKYKITLTELSLDDPQVNDLDVDKCMICYDVLSDSPIFNFMCRHRFHKECILQCRNTLCPLCREDFAGSINMKDAKKIKANDKKFKQDEIDEEHNNLVSDDIRNNRLRNTLVNPRVEIEAAFKFLSEFGIPESYFPTSFTMRAPTLPGILYASIVSQVMGRMSFDLESDGYYDSDEEIPSRSQVDDRQRDSSRRRQHSTDIEERAVSSRTKRKEKSKAKDKRIAK